MRSEGVLMRKIQLRFKPATFTAGATLMAVGSGVAGVLPALIVPAGIIFLGGIVLTLASLFSFAPAAVVFHQRWDTEKIYKALDRGPHDAVLRILQTWFPEENFVAHLRAMYLAGKHFDLRVMLMDPGEDGVPSSLLASRVELRDLSPSMAAEEVRSAMLALIRLKETVDRHRADHHQRRRNTVDLEIRAYTFMPFGPIYQIADDVMFVGLYLNQTTSAEAPMIEIRNTPGNPLWRLFEHHFDEGWSATSSKVVFPTGAVSSVGV